jgi:hypothetical protein
MTSMPVADDGRAEFEDRVLLAVESLRLRQERRDGFLSDDDVLDTADDWTTCERDDEGCFVEDNPTDYIDLREELFAACSQEGSE